MNDLQRTQWSCVINGNENKSVYEINIDLTNFCNYEVTTWFKIIHDMDINLNGERKTPHIHAIFELSSRVRKSTLIKRLSIGLDINVNQISVDEVKNISKITQYLIHANDKEKYQYSIEKIETNNEERLKYLLMNNEKTGLTTEELFDIIDNSKSVRELIKKIGIDMYMKYGRVIDLLWKEKRENERQCYYYESKDIHRA